MNASRRPRRSGRHASALGIAVLWCATAGAAEALDHEAPPAAGAPRRAAEELIEAEAPPFTPGIYPCTQCHRGSADASRRRLGFHDEIQDKLERGHGRRWCLDCHDLDSRDVLHLSSGEKVPFTESYRVCGQCHYDKYRDWRLGIHGKRTGHWNWAIRPTRPAAPSSAARPRARR